MNKKMFYFYRNWAEMLYLLPDDIMAQVVKAMLAHALEKDAPDISTIADAIVTPILSKMDEDDEAYANKCERNRESAARRWQNANASERNANVCERIQDECERMRTDADIDIDTDTDKIRDIDTDKRKDKREDKGKEDKRRKADEIEQVLIAWNTIQDRGLIPKVSDLKPDTQRYRMLRSRIDEYGIEKVLEAIDNVSASAFLKGRNNRAWACNLEWVVKPNNFPKVLEGYYSDTQPLQNNALDDFLKGGTE